MAEKFNKVAVDEAAKKYWKLLWPDYGEDLCRDIPRRIKAALQDHKKIATMNEVATVLPVAHATSLDGLQLEGIYKDATTKLMFHVAFDKDLEVKEIQSFELR